VWDGHFGLALNRAGGAGPAGIKFLVSYVGLEGATRIASVNQTRQLVIHDPDAEQPLARVSTNVLPWR
jgi:hypothetical protein